MRKRLLSMQKTRFLDKNKTVLSLKRIAEKIRSSQPDVKKIVLFGSLTRGNYTGSSDADILILLEKSEKRFLDRIPEFLLLFADAPIATDVFPYTTEEACVNGFAQRALRDGLVLA